MTVSFPNSSTDAFVRDIEARVWQAIRKTINKFREQPYYFFTESDIVTYLCQCLYTSRLEVVRGNRRIYLVHREYPTNFRYEKDQILTMLAPHPLCPPAGQRKQGTRGNFDLAVLLPDFVERAPSVADIVNKNVRDLEARYTQYAKELLFAIECKYVINNSKSFVEEILRDNRKLSFARRHGARHAVNLVFCNIQSVYEASLQEAVLGAETGVTAAFIQSFYEGKDEDGEKITPKPLVHLCTGDRVHRWPAVIAYQEVQQTASRCEEAPCEQMEATETAPQSIQAPFVIDIMRNYSTWETHKNYAARVQSNGSVLFRKGLNYLDAPSRVSARTMQELVDCITRNRILSIPSTNYPSSPPVMDDIGNIIISMTIGSSTHVWKSGTRDNWGQEQTKFDTFVKVIEKALAEAGSQSDGIYQR